MSKGLIDSEFERRSIESMILAAGNFVQPSDELRPRALEAAKEVCGDQRTERKLGGFTIAILLAAFLSSPAIDYLEVLRSNSVMPSAAEMEERGLAYSDQPGIGVQWGLAEAFNQLRRVQASQLSYQHR
jgi:hypothetical protein